MDTKELIANIRAALANVQASGQQFVAVQSLLQYLFELERGAPEANEVRRLQHESSLAFYRAEHEAGLQMLRSVIDSGTTALTSSILINGGATVALLAYAANLFSKGQTSNLGAALVTALVCFAFGVLSGAVAAGAGYITQYCYYRRWNRSAAGFHIGSVVLIVASYALFAGGVIAAYHAFA